MCNWYRAGYLAIDYKIFDIGIQTREALERYLNGVSIEHMVNHDVLSNGNGALMRVLPLALWHKGPDQDLIGDAFKQTQITHGHIRSKLCSAIYCLWARNLLKEVEVDQAWQLSVNVIKDHFSNGQHILTEIENHIDIGSDFKIQGTGYVVDCLLSAKYALTKNNYRDVIKTAISLGNDTDTTACVAGGLAGIIYGEQVIPESWKLSLKGQEMVEPLLEALLKTNA